MKWIEKLRKRWELRSTGQVILVLLAFACTGITIMYLKRPLLYWLAGERGDSALATVLYYIFILPLYNIVLLGYGFVFGQFRFFWAFEKRFVERFFSWFKKGK